MKIIYWLLMVLPGIAFFMDDFGEATIGLRVFGVCLFLVVIYDIARNKNISQYICKIIYFPIFLLIWMRKYSKHRKQKKKEQRIRAYRYFEPWYFI